MIWSAGIAPVNQALTLLRTRGVINYYLSTASAAHDGFSIASGIYMMTAEAFAVGATAVLDPIDDSNSDMWLWHSFADVNALTGTIADGVNAVGCVVRQVIDSKAMRKDFDSQRVLVGVTQVIERGTALMEMQADTRMLFKL